MKLLIIRPQPGADASAARVRQAGFEPVILPLFAIEPVAWQVPSAAAYDALVLTSGNAVRAAGDRLLHLAALPVYAVGSATAKAVAAAGLSAVYVGAGGLAELLPVAAAQGHRRLLWPTGEDHSDVALPADVALDVRTVYKSAALPKPAQFEALVAQSAAVLLHSARAARYFADLSDARGATARSGITLATLSPHIAHAAGSGWRHVLIAAQPDDASLLSEVQRHFTTLTGDPNINPGY